MKWLHFILSHSIFIAICAVAMAFQTALLLHVDIDGYLYGFIFFATLCSYNFYWILSALAFKKKLSVQVLKNYYTNFLVLLIAAAGDVFCILKIDGILPLAAISVLLTLLYALPLLPFSWLNFARKAGVIKTTLLSFTWAFVTVYLPYKVSGVQHFQSFLMLFNNRFLFMMMLCIIFDNRDMEVDKLRGLRSLATDVSPRALHYIMMFIFTAYIINGVVFRLWYGELQQLFPFLLMGFICILVYGYSRRKQGYLFYYFITDGLMLLSSLLTILASI